MELREGNAGQAVGPYKVSHETAEGSGCGGLKAKHLGKVPGLRNNKDLKFLYSLQEGWQPPARPGLQCPLEAVQDPVPGRPDRG